MAIFVDNLVVQGLSGRLGKQLVVRRRRDGSYVVAAAPPRNTGRKPTDNQQAYRKRFSAAIAYAKVAKNEPAVIAAAEQRHMTAFNWAVSEYLGTHQGDLQPAAQRSTTSK